MKKQSSIHSLLLIYCLIQLGYIFTFGSFSLPGIYILVGTLIIFCVYKFKPEIITNFKINPTTAFLTTFLLISTIAQFNIVPTLREPGILTRPTNFVELITVMRVTSLLMILLGLLTLFFKKPLFLLILGIVITIILRISVIITSPAPWVDIYNTIKLGAYELIKGNNPYSAYYTKLYPNVIPNYYPYFPGSIFLTMPSTILFKDPRYIYVLAEAITAFILWKISTLTFKTNKANPVLISLIFLASPIANYLQLRSLLEPLLFMFISLCIYFYIIQNKKTFLVLLGLLLTIKQTIFIFLFFSYKYLRLKPRELLLPLSIFSLILLPFVIWSFSDFWHDIFKVYLDLPVRHDGLTLNTLIFNLTSRNVPIFLFLAIWVAVFIVLLSEKQHGIKNLLVASAFWYLFFFMFNKYAFGEFYYMISNLILFSTALPDEKK